MTGKNRKRVSALLQILARAIEDGRLECEDLLTDAIKEILDDDYTRTDAAKYLNVSERTFDRYRRDGLISDGRKRAGGLRTWKKRELDIVIHNIHHEGGGKYSLIFRNQEIWFLAFYRPVVYN